MNLRSKMKFHFIQVERPTATALWMDNDHSEQKFSYSDLKTESIRAAVALRNVLELDLNSKNRNSSYILVILPRVPGTEHISIEV